MNFAEHSRFYVGGREGEQRAQEVHDSSFSEHQDYVSVTQLQSSDGCLYPWSEPGRTCYHLKGLGSIISFLPIIGSCFTSADLSVTAAQGRFIPHSCLA